MSVRAEVVKFSCWWLQSGHRPHIAQPLRCYLIRRWPAWQSHWFIHQRLLAMEPAPLESGTKNYGADWTLMLAFVLGLALVWLSSFNLPSQIKVWLESDNVNSYYWVNTGTRWTSHRPLALFPDLRHLITACCHLTAPVRMAVHLNTCTCLCMGN